MIVARVHAEISTPNGVTSQKAAPVGRHSSLSSAMLVVRSVRDAIGEWQLKILVCERRRLCELHLSTRTTSRSTTHCLCAQWKMRSEGASSQNTFCGPSRRTRRITQQKLQAHQNRWKKNAVSGYSTTTRRLAVCLACSRSIMECQRG